MFGWDMILRDLFFYQFVDTILKALSVVHSCEFHWVSSFRNSTERKTLKILPSNLPSKISELAFRSSFRFRVINSSKTPKKCHSEEELPQNVYSPFFFSCYEKERSLLLPRGCCILTAPACFLAGVRIRAHLQIQDSTSLLIIQA